MFEDAVFLSLDSRYLRIRVRFAPMAVTSPALVTDVLVPRHKERVVVMRLHSHVSEIQQDFDCLLERMRHRLYLETTPVLAFYWLRTICEKGYQEPEWTALDHLLRQADQSVSSDQAFQSISDLREWIQQTRHRNPPPSIRSVSRGEQTREVNSDALVPYVFRLLNEWLPVEAANLLDQRAG